jgi:hypothetical protein
LAICFASFPSSCLQIHKIGVILILDSWKLKEFIGKLLDIIQEIRKVTDDKINIQEALYFICQQKPFQKLRLKHICNVKKK